jgi:DMSO/TMAO reductase YedYZ heme-binding membrane subunit
MLQALGFTYSEVLPLHRWLGALIFFWSCLHTVGYILYYHSVNALAEEFNFYDIGRSTMNIMGCVALVSILCFWSLFIRLFARCIANSVFFSLLTRNFSLQIKHVK